MSTHKYTLKNNKHKNKHLQNAWNVYGEESFLFETLEIVENKKLIIEREQFYLDLYKPYNRNFGFNKAKIAGNTSGIKPSLETRLKQSEAAKKRPRTKLTEEQILNLKNRYKDKTAPWSKISLEQVREIRRMYHEDYTTKELSTLFPVSQSTIQEIIRNEIWKDDNYTYIKRRNKGRLK
jgi:group I intron endonuclease